MINIYMVGMHVFIKTCLTHNFRRKDIKPNMMMTISKLESLICTFEVVNVKQKWKRTRKRHGKTKKYVKQNFRDQGQTITYFNTKVNKRNKEKKQSKKQSSLNVTGKVKDRCNAVHQVRQE